MAVLTDPGGAAIGMWQPGLHKGFGVVGEPGAPSWFELHTRDYEAAVGFYRDVFRWDTHVVERHRRVPLHDAQRTATSWLAGIMDASGVPSRRRPCPLVGVLRRRRHRRRAGEDRRARWLDRRAAQDTPYGRLAIAADPTGASSSSSPPTRMPATAPRAEVLASLAAGAVTHRGASGAHSLAKVSICLMTRATASRSSSGG